MNQANSASSPKVAISNGVITVDGFAAPLASIMGVETGEGGQIARSAFILLACLACPIASMVLFTLIHEQPLRMILGLATAAGPMVGIVVSQMWKKPWAVIAEFPTQYRAIYSSRDKAEVEAITATIRKALPK
jgi:hypothetical protein